MQIIHDRPILQDKSVRELLAVMKENDASTRAALVAVLIHVTKIEQQSTQMAEEIAELRGEIADRLSLHKALISLRHNIIDGAKAAVSAFKEQGIAVLNNVAQFFKIRPMLEWMRNALDKNIRACERRIGKIEAASKEYHETGLHLKNMGRAVMGKAPLQEPKPAGKVAGILIESLQNECAACFKMQKGIDSALGGLKRLEDRSAGRVSFQEHLAAYRKERAETPVSATPTHTQPATETR